MLRPAAALVQICGEPPGTRPPSLTQPHIPLLPVQALDLGLRLRPAPACPSDPKPQDPPAYPAGAKSKPILDKRRCQKRRRSQKKVCPPAPPRIPRQNHPPVPVPPRPP